VKTCEADEKNAFPLVLGKIRNISEPHEREDVRSGMENLLAVFSADVSVKETAGGIAVSGSCDVDVMADKDEEEVTVEGVIDGAGMDPALELKGAEHVITCVANPRR